MSKIKLKEANRELEVKLAIANRTIQQQMSHIEMLNKQLDQQDKVIERKDKQFLGFMCAYQDEIINRGC